MNVTVIRSNRKTICAETDGYNITVRAPFGVSFDIIEKFLDRNMKKILACAKKQREKKEQTEKIKKLNDGEICQCFETAKDVIEKKAEYFSSLIGVRYGRIKLKKMRTRWGSCSSEGNMNFNFLLALTPEYVLSGVVAHEVCHLKHMNHSRSFYDELYKIYPEYERCRIWLKENGFKILAKI